MFGGRRYFGLTGTSLNVAIGLLAGLDFLYEFLDSGVKFRQLTMRFYIVDCLAMTKVSWAACSPYLHS